VLETGAHIIALGGDHSVTLPLLRAHAQRYGRLAVVHLDAHCDAWAGRLDHSTPFRHAVTEGLIGTEAFIQVGVRGPVWSAEDIPAAQALGAEIVTAEEAIAAGMAAVAERIRARVGERPLYVSLDLDAADPAYAPGVGTPEVGGLTSLQLLQLVRGLRGLHLVGCDLVELCPPADSGEITAVLAANLAFELLCLLALGQRLAPRQRDARN
jgi:agmatinase